jgi:hypothetical protein
MTDKWHTHTHPNQYANVKILECYGIKQYTDREVTANRSDIIIKKKERDRKCAY